MGVPVVYGSFAAATMARNGVPGLRETLVPWLLGGLLVLSLANVSDFLRSVLLEWLPFLAALTAYDYLRGSADELAPIHVDAQIWIDAHVFGAGAVPTVWLQERLWNGAPRTWDYASWAVYLTFFFATPVVAAALWRTSRPRFRRYVAAVTALSFASVATFALYPAAPPWLASDSGALPATTRLVWVVGDSVPIVDWRPMFEKGAAWANPVASVPSLHEGLTVLIVLFFWRTVPRALRPLLAAYPVAMAFALVYGAEHYVVDLVLGAVYAVVVYAAVTRVAERAAGWKAASTAAFRKPPRRGGEPADAVRP